MNVNPYISYRYYLSLRENPHPLKVNGDNCLNCEKKRYLDCQDSRRVNQRTATQAGLRNKQADLTRLTRRESKNCNSGGIEKQASRSDQKFEPKKTVTESTNSPTIFYPLKTVLLVYWRTRSSMSGSPSRVEYMRD